MGRDRLITDTTLLVEKAFAIIDKEGYAHFSARKLAGVLGISHMTVYNYMDREEILSQVVFRGFSMVGANILPHVEACKSGAITPFGIFSAIADELLAFAKLYPNIYKFMFQERISIASEDPRLRALYMGNMEWVQDVISADIIVDLSNDVVLFLVLINGLVLAYLNLRTDDAEKICRHSIARAYKLILGHYSTLA